MLTHICMHAAAFAAAAFGGGAAAFGWRVAGGGLRQMRSPRGVASCGGSSQTKRRSEFRPTDCCNRAGRQAK